MATLVQKVTDVPSFIANGTQKNLPFKSFLPDDDIDEEAYDWKSLYASHKDVEAPIHDSRDDGTSDSWIKRSPVLIRLTGKHPLNCEPPLNLLMQYGFITPASLHYVRSHGPVPQGDWSTWTVEVTGLVKHPYRFTMDELVNGFEPVEIPITLACSGNRRKEQNMVRQTIGFNWGPGATSTSVWRGARLYDILKKCGIMGAKSGAMYICFEGAEDLPVAGGCKYGTSIRREVAMDPSRDIMLAYMQNGELLPPDHGFPVRVIVPGFTGGRSVKWVKRVTVTTHESDSYYHYRDNRVLPSHVDAELANSEGWWYKPEYIINELNVNSVITTPGHDEVLPINALNMQRPYVMRGYAHSGGGRMVTRVEITLDGGDTWRLCTLNHPEKPSKYGKYWCWCFWSVEIELMHLLDAKEVAVRAWDESNNTQPAKLSWNVLGMFNNSWFRVKMHLNRSPEGELGIVFEHPTQPGNGVGGWMAHEKQPATTTQSDNRAHQTSTSTVKESTSVPSIGTSTKQYTMEEVSKHSTRESAWIVIHGHVYDCTSYLKDHPGGADSILINAGTDCTEEFDSIHSDRAKGILEKFQIGELVTTPQTSSTSHSSITSSPIIEKKGASNISHMPNLQALTNPREKVKCTLIAKTETSTDTRIFRFALPSSEQVLGLPTGKHIFLSAMVDGKLCLRAYTPTSHSDVKGYLDLLVKVYFKGENPKFPHGGVMSQYLDSLPIGSTIDIKGPLGDIEYTGRGNFLVNGERRFAKRLAMIAGGTGITPIYQVIQAILCDQPHDTTEMHVVYANRTEDDILLREDLDKWARMYPKQLKVWYVVNEVKHPEIGWKYDVGHVNEDILKTHVPFGKNVMPPAKPDLEEYATTSYANRSRTSKLFCGARMGSVLHKGRGKRKQLTSMQPYNMSPLSANMSPLSANMSPYSEKHTSINTANMSPFSEKLISSSMTNDTLALICGPPPMIQFAVLPNLEKMGYDLAKHCLIF
ncbi:Nitrate reductase [Rhynchospora pubera]|uniref:Nitrate reductase n=1 Tax=Rhynchospora pubera TaxID=906938 RepID=A0AAV8HKV3_9POAL|nr:Nitrate reductase [Rhynchospora pubera]